MKILVVDDHPLVLDALAQILPEADPNIECCVRPIRPSRRRSRQQSRHCSGPAGPRPPRRPWPRLLGDLKLDYPASPSSSSATYDQATVMAAMGGRARLHPEVGRRRKLLTPCDAFSTAGCARYRQRHRARRRRCPGGFAGLGLTVRQTDVLKLLVQGKPNKLICRDLRLSEGTVKVHVSAILRALMSFAHGGHRRAARRGISVDTLAARRNSRVRHALTSVPPERRVRHRDRSDASAAARHRCSCTRGRNRSPRSIARGIGRR